MRVLVSALLLLGLPGLAAADYRESYRKGREAVDRKRWAEVAERMREALAENPTEGEKVKLYGVRFEPYLPHFYLGLALVYAGDCAGAVKAFQASEEQGAIRGTPEEPALRQRRKDCEAKLAQAAPLAPPRPTPTPRPTVFPEATPEPTPSAVARLVEPTPTAPQPAAVATPAARQPAAGPPSVPPELLAAARAYFDGRYDEAEAKLARLPEGSGRVGAQALLLRSASRYALFRVGAERDAELRRSAMADAAAARRADPALLPDRQAFSPAFLQFYRDAK
jgi:hypothetical protein